MLQKRVLHSEYKRVLRKVLNNLHVLKLLGIKLLTKIVLWENTHRNIFTNAYNQLLKIVTIIAIVERVLLGADHFIKL